MNIPALHRAHRTWLSLCYDLHAFDLSMWIACVSIMPLRFHFSFNSVCNFLLKLFEKVCAMYIYNVSCRVHTSFPGKFSLSMH
jgi:hypothetical protein